jgi:hypothetical protein
MRSLSSRGTLSTWIAAVGLIALACFVGPAVASGDERRLDADLSLTGGCTVPEVLDPVQDPECPENPPATGNHPAAPFARPIAVTTDVHGNIYVSNRGKKEDGTEGRIDIFAPDGRFISEVKTPAAQASSPSGEPIARGKAIAVDSEGVLYLVVQEFAETRVVRFTPTGIYEPENRIITYGGPAQVVRTGSRAPAPGLAIDPRNDHLFANFAAEAIWEFKSAAEGNDVVRQTDAGTFPNGTGITVDGVRHKLYVSHDEESLIDIFDLDQVNGADEYVRIGAIDGSGTPAGAFVNSLSVAVDEGNGHLLVLDGGVNRIYEFDEAGAYLTTIEHGFQVEQGAAIGIDNSPFSPNGALSPRGPYLFVPSHRTGTGHSFAFEVSKVGPPEVESVGAGSIGENEAELQAIVNPGSLATTYTFEYLTLQAFEDAGKTFAGATLAGSGELPADNAGREAAATVTGLQAGTEYRFRVIATNAEGSDEATGGFATFPAPSLEPVACPNRDLRTGLSKLLPDCRAYELVTPPDSNARAPIGSPLSFFPNRQVSPNGNSLPWIVEGGSLPEQGGTGSIGSDPYLSSRGPDGWSTAYIGPAGSDSTAVFPGGTSPDHGYSFWTSSTIGPASIDGAPTGYVRYPDGHSEVLGAGSIGTDPRALGRLISEGGDHMIFETGNTGPAVRLEPQAAPSGTTAVYDRAPTGELRVVSLLPGDLPLAAGERGIFTGASLDGKGVAFTVGSTLYLRYDNSETYEIGEGVDFAGLAEGGNRIFYIEGGQFFRFDALTGERTTFSAGTVTPVTISADGSSAYFVSTSVLTTSRNPNDAKAKSGKHNLYLSREGAISFVGTLTDRDVVGEEGEAEQVDGLGLWMDALSVTKLGYLGLDPSRSTPDGSVLLFESGAALAGYDPEGHQQVYRYDSVANELDCLSCNPTGAPATGRARLQSVQREGAALFSPKAWLANLRADGRRAFFESTEALVPGDADGLQDVYEWEDEGVGSCTSPGGCVYLITSGHSIRNDYLWAVSESGDDVFFITADLVLPVDADETPSIYDARVGGGFPSTASSECQGEGCRPQMQAPPSLPSGNTPVQGAGDNFKPRRCPKGKHKVKRGGKVRCVKKKKHGNRAGTKKKGPQR